MTIAIREHVKSRAIVSHLSLPPGFDHLASGVQRYREDFSYDQSVFVMMKFTDPNSSTAEDSELLDDIWLTIDNSLSEKLD